MVNTFPYLGSNITNDGEIALDVESRIAKASRAFGCLRGPVFQNSNFSVSTKRAVYCGVILSVLLYGAETWTIKASSKKRLSSFYNRCTRTILGVSRYQQWSDRITSRQLAFDFGMEEPLDDLLMAHRLR